MSDVSVEIDQQQDKQGKPTGQWLFALFLDGNLAATGCGSTVPEAAQWCLRRLKTNLERGEAALEAMGLVPQNGSKP